jgi:hypothetical protein
MTTPHNDNIIVPDGSEEAIRDSMVTMTIEKPDNDVSPSVTTGDMPNGAPNGKDAKRPPNFTLEDRKPSGIKTILDDDTRNDGTPLYPTPFYCPLSGNLLQNPVVSTDGISYCRTALEERGDDMSKVYENRSLKTIIDEAVEYQTSSTFKRLGLNVRQLSQQLLPYHRPLPEGFYCPITLSLMHVPVIDPEGYSYEKVAIENWIRCNGASPVTRRAMTVDELYPNHTLTLLMTEEMSKGEEVIHPAFKQMSEEPAPIIVADVEHALDARNIRTFPSTPEELASANRRLRARQCHLFCAWSIVFLILAVLAWMVPVISTILLVLVLLHVGVVAGHSSNNRPGGGSHDDSSVGNGGMPPPSSTIHPLPALSAVHTV